MSIGLLALLDDVAAIAKAAAASLDDVASQAAKAGAKAAGVVIDDAAVTPRYVVGFSAARELPIVAKIAVGSLRNKLLILLPAALALSYLLPWGITPLLMAGGMYLCYEGVEELFEKFLPHHAGAHEAQLGTIALNGGHSRTRKSRARSRRISFPPNHGNCAGGHSERKYPYSGVGARGGGHRDHRSVYGVVALIVKADDAGVALAGNAARSVSGAMSRAIGRGLVLGMPGFLVFLSAAGTAAMIWVGGGIIVHGLEGYGLVSIGHAIHAAGDAVARMLGPVSGAAEWVVVAALSGVVGLVIGAITIRLRSLSLRRRGSC